MTPAGLGSLPALLGGSRRVIAVSATLAVLQAALLVPVGLLTAHAFDDLVPAKDIGALVWTGLALVGLTLVSTALGLLARHLVLRATKGAVHRLRVRLLGRLLALPLAGFDDTDPAVLHATITQDTERLDVVSAAVAAQILPAAIIATGLTAALVWVAPVLTAALAIAFPVLVVVSRAPGATIRERTRAYASAFDRFSVRIGFASREALLLRTEGAEAAELEKGTAEVKAVTRTGHALAFLQYAAAQAGAAVTTSAGVIVLVIGAIQVAHGSLSIGSLLAFSVLVGPLRGQAGTILTGLPAVFAGGESLRRLEAVLTLDAADPYAGSAPHTFSGNLELRDVRFAFRPDEEVLRGVDLELRPGEVVGLAGPNGAGKTTLWRLALGLRRPTAGTVLADGRPFDELDVPALRRGMAVVPQDPVLVAGTVAENIAFGTPGAGLGRVREAAVLATADRVAEGLPEGYATRIGDGGRALSGGQAQRIAIARALARRPAVLVLDEPTSHLDAAATAALLTTVRQLPWGPAVLLVSHDPSVLAAADRRWTLSEGVLR